MLLSPVLNDGEEASFANPDRGRVLREPQFERFADGTAGLCERSPEVLHGAVSTSGAPRLLVFVAQAYLVLLSARYGYDLTNVGDKRLVDPVEFELDAPNVEIALVEPEHCGGQLLREASTHENHAHVGDGGFVLVFDAEEVFEELSGIFARTLGLKEARVGIDDLCKGKGCNHRCVPQGLELHVRARIALELDDHEVCVSVDRQEIDTTPTILPIAELLGDHQEVGVDDLDVLLEQPLKVLPLAKPFSRERRRAHLLKSIVPYPYNRHTFPR